MRYVIASAIVMLLSSTPILRADETVSIGGSNAVLLRPSAPRATVILMPGGDGYIAAGPGGTIGKLNGNQLVRTRNAYLAHGLAVLVVDSDVNLTRAVELYGCHQAAGYGCSDEQGHASRGARYRRRSETGRACPDIRFPDRWLRQPPERRKYSWLAKIVATHFGHRAPARFMPLHPARWR